MRNSKDAGEAYAAIDIGASSGRVIMGWLEEGKMRLEEVHRFDNVQKRSNGHDCWDIDALFSEVVAGLKAAREKTGLVPMRIGIDTWGVDFVLLDEDDCVLGDAVAYRDARTQGMYEVADELMDPGELYARTGIQRQPFNTLYQLLALKRERPEELEAARSFLMIPDYLVWKLTGIKVNEYTNATTTGMLNAVERDWDSKVLDSMGIDRSLFMKPSMPGETVGCLTEGVSRAIGYQTKVVLPASHDTGSAFLAVPARDEKAAYISSGTWSLLGVELPEPLTTPEAYADNFTNEGGYQARFRFLKNIMGLWMNQSVRREVNGVDYVEGKTSHSAMLDHTVSFDELRAMCREAEPFEAYVDVDDDRFLSPDSMIEEIKAACEQGNQSVPQSIGQIMRTNYCSLARSYARNIDRLRQLTGREYTSINIVGGGCQDDYLNQATADACGIPVFAGPIEGTCIGNLIVQMISGGEFEGLAQARKCVADSFDVKRIDPQSGCA